MTITTIGLDLAKSVFQAHGVDESGATILVKRLHRKQMLPFFSKLSPCLVGVEACGTAHYWARTLAAMGHEVRLIPPSYVKAYVKRGKSDALDAEAICEAVQRPSGWDRMRPSRLPQPAGRLAGLDSEGQTAAAAQICDHHQMGYRRAAICSAAQRVEPDTAD